MGRLDLPERMQTRVGRKLQAQHRAMSTDPIIMSSVVYVARVRKAFDKNTMDMFFSVRRDAEPALAALSKGVLHVDGKFE